MERIVCEACGGNKFIRRDSAPGKIECENCGATYSDLQPKEKYVVLREVDKPADPDLDIEEESSSDTENTSSSENNLVGFLAVFFLLLSICGPMGYLMVADFLKPATITTNGLYQLHSGCSFGTTVVEFGQAGQPPLFAVYPETENDRWSFTKEEQAKVKDIFRSGSYLWVHCQKDVTLGYYSQTYPMPVDGMQVVIGDNRPTRIPLESTLTPQP